MGSISPAKATASRPLRIVIGGDSREVRSLAEARSFLRENKAGAVAEFLLKDLDPKAPGALVAFRDRLNMMRQAL